ncbi:MAG: hypothetical protein COB15_03120 [Flavobacteriales bacterium]|nr:MAG: hypothetical protein COB15_03120 [Flavobacteriales bacterium]
MKMKVIIGSLLITLFFKGFSQNPASNINYEQTKKVEQKMPQFPGGNNAFYDYLDENVTLPEGFDKEKFLKEHKNQYVPISVGFTIDVDGSIIDAKVIDGEDELLDQKALEIVKNMPKWDPGYLNGKPIKVQYAIPVRFNII